MATKTEVREADLTEEEYEQFFELLDRLTNSDDITRCRDKPGYLRHCAERYNCETALEEFVGWFLPTPACTGPCCSWPLVPTPRACRRGRASGHSGTLQRSSSMVVTTGLDPAAVLAALYNNSKPQGMGFLQADSSLMDVRQAQALLDDVRSKSNRVYFDYLRGRVMKVDLTNPDGFEERLYDRDLGTGAAQCVVDELHRRAADAVLAS
jgi:hypothetical protein